MERAPSQDPEEPRVFTPLVRVVLTLMELLGLDPRDCIGWYRTIRPPIETPGVSAIVLHPFHNPSMAGRVNADAPEATFT